MKRMVLACALVLACGGVRAEAVLSCDEVNEVGESLTALGIAIDDENAQIGAGSEEDEALRQTVLGLADIAEAEGDEDLANASEGMAQAWADNDRDGFVDALADAVARLAIIAGTECE